MRASSPHRSPDRYDDYGRDRYAERYRDTDSQSGDKESLRSYRSSRSENRRDYRDDRIPEPYDERTTSKRERTRAHSPTSSEYSHGRSPTRYRSRSPSPGLVSRKSRTYSPSKEDYPSRSSRASSPGYDSYGRTKDRSSLKSDKSRDRFMDRDRRERYDSEERTNLSSLIGSKAGQMFSENKKKRDSEDFERASIQKKRLSEEFARERDRKLERHLSHSSKDGLCGSPGSTKMGAPKHIPDVLSKSKHKRKVSKHGSKRKHKKDQPYDPFDDMGQSESSSDSSSSGSSSSDSDSDLDTDNSSHHTRDTSSGGHVSRASHVSHADVTKLQKEKHQLLKMIQQLDDGSDSVDEEGNRRPHKRARVEAMLENSAGRDSPRIARLREVEEEIKAKQAALFSSLGYNKSDSSLNLRKPLDARRSDSKKGEVIAARPRSRDPLGLMSPQFNEPMEVDDYNSGPEKSPRDLTEGFASRKKRRDTVDGHKSRRYRTNKTAEDNLSSGDEDTASHKSSSSSARPRLSFEGRKSGFESEGSTKSESHDRSRSNSKTEVIVPLYVIGPDCPQDPRTPRSPEKDRRDNPISLPLPKFGRHMQACKVGASPRTVPVTKPLTVTIHNTPTTASAPVSATSLTTSPHLSPGSLGMVSPTFSPDENASPKLQLSPVDTGSKMEVNRERGQNTGPDDLDEPPPPPPPPPPGKQAYVEAYITSQQQLHQEMQQQAAAAAQSVPSTPDKDNLFTVPSTDTTPKDTTPKSAERDPRKRRDSQTGSVSGISPVTSRTTSESETGEPVSPGRPSLEERIRALDEKLNITQTAVQNTTKAVSTTSVMDYREKFKSKIKKKGEPSQFEKSTPGNGAAEPSDIVKSLLSRKSIFDQDSRRLENIDEKYEPKEGQRLFRSSFSGDALPGQPMPQSGMLSPNPAVSALPGSEAPKFPASILRNKDSAHHHGMVSPGAPPSSAPPAFMGTAPAPPQPELLPQSINSGLDMFPFLNPGLPKQNSDPLPGSQPFFRKPSTEAVKHTGSSSGVGSKSSSLVKKDNTPLVVAAPSGPNVSPVSVRQESTEGAGASMTSATPPLPSTPTTPTSILKKESAFASPPPAASPAPVTPVTSNSATPTTPSVTKKEPKDATSASTGKKDSSGGSSGLLGKRKASEDCTNSNGKDKQKSENKTHTHKLSGSTSNVKTENKSSDEPESKKPKVSSSSNSKDKDKKPEPSKSSSSHKDSSSKKSSSSSSKHSSSSTKSPEKKYKSESDKKESEKHKSGEKGNVKDRDTPSKDKDSSKDKPKQESESKSKDSDSKCKPDKPKDQSNDRKGDKKDSSHTKTKLGETKHKDKSKESSTSSLDKSKSSGSKSEEKPQKSSDKHKNEKHHSRDHSTDKSKSDHSDRKDKSEKSKSDQSHKGDKSKTEHSSDKKSEQKDKGSSSKEHKQGDKKIEKSNSKDTGGAKGKHVKEKELKDKGGEDRGKSNTHQSSSDRKKSSSGDKDRSVEKCKDKGKQEKVKS